MRSYNDPGRNVAQHDGLLKAMKKYSDNPRDQHDHGEVMNKTNGMLHAVCVLEGKYNNVVRLSHSAKNQRSFSNYSLSEQRL